jgi:hypothetical protein
MPTPQTPDTPAPEPLALRLMRDTFDQRGIPLYCPRRQCRRSRHCGGPVHRPQQPLTSGERLPGCTLEARPEARRQFLDMAGEVLQPFNDSTAPGTWPEDRQAANHLRRAMAIVARIHTRPGPHPDSERAALAAWQAADPDPELTTACVRLWRHTSVEKPTPARPETPA